MEDEFRRQIRDVCGADDTASPPLPQHAAAVVAAATGRQPPCTRTRTPDIIAPSLCLSLTLSTPYTRIPLRQRFVNFDKQLNLPDLT